jgi:hypothetical protein
VTSLYFFFSYKVVAISNFNEAKEKQERLELKGAPTKPGVANLMHSLTKR